ncbi:hypothetical protein [Ruegeria halocynthiae]|uniref:hypothetical protein n=1 Tax=Ruegeria halocynthiae TaxID=985054 RepID=UPI001268AA51|nr:hypothetical protein [Ruegeria halocynthiae]
MVNWTCLKMRYCVSRRLACRMQGSFFLGDCTDWGPQSRAALELLHQGQVDGHNRIFLRGNRDQMCALFLEEYPRNDTASRAASASGISDGAASEIACCSYTQSFNRVSRWANSTPTT